MSTVTELLSSPHTVGEWVLVPEASSLQFKNSTFWGLMTVTGRFTEFSGAGRVGADGTVTGRIVIKAASLQTGIGARDRHLRSADFFDVEHYPDILVDVTGVEVDGDNVTVAAQLSIRGHTVAMPFAARVARLDDGDLRVTGTTTVQRDRLGVSGNMLGMMGDTTTVSADATFSRSGP